MRDEQPVEIRRGVSTFVHFCYGTAPSFDKLEDEALSGSYKLKPNGWLEHSNLQISVVVRDYSDFKSCQLTFTSDQPVRVFEEHMRYPFNARQVSKAELRTLYGSEFRKNKIDNLINRAFASKTTFDGGVPAMFYGYVLDTQENPAGRNSFGLILQTTNARASQS